MTSCVLHNVAKLQGDNGKWLGGAAARPPAAGPDHPPMDTAAVAQRRGFERRRQVMDGYFVVVIVDAFFSDDALETLLAILNNREILKNTELKAPPRNPCLVRRSTEEPEMAVYAEGERFPIVIGWNTQLRAVEAEGQASDRGGSGHPE